jgi:hypothetical protein
MFQTDFLEETYKDFLYNGRDINKTMQKLSKWQIYLIIKKHQLTGTMLYLVLTKQPTIITYLTFKQNGDEVYWKNYKLTLYKFRFRS